MVVLGIWLVDIKERLKKLTNEPENEELYRIVIRGTTHTRERPGNSRFGTGSIAAPLSKRKTEKVSFWKLITYKEHNWLGSTWMKNHNKDKMPSLNQISFGLIAEAMVQLNLAMGIVKE